MKRNTAVAVSSVEQQLANACLRRSLPAGRAGSIAVAAFADDGTLAEAEVLACLPEAEALSAQRLADPAERRHFIIRRCFQRVFVKDVLAWDGPMRTLALEHRLDTQPKCLDAPACSLSFSSSGPVSVACASLTVRVGIDLERIRPIANAVALAQRFFTPGEADAIAAQPAPEQSLAFLRHWTVKEAGLKAIGRGIVSGLNSFVLQHDGNHHHIEINGLFSPKNGWIVDYPDLCPQHIVAIVHNSGF